MEEEKDDLSYLKEMAARAVLQEIMRPIDPSYETKPLPTNTYPGYESMPDWIKGSKSKEVEYLPEVLSGENSWGSGPTTITEDGVDIDGIRESSKRDYPLRLIEESDSPKSISQLDRERSTGYVFDTAESKYPRTFDVVGSDEFYDEVDRLQNKADMAYENKWNTSPIDSFTDTQLNKRDKELHGRLMSDIGTGREIPTQHEIDRVEGVLESRGYEKVPNKSKQAYRPFKFKKGNKILRVIGPAAFLTSLFTSDDAAAALDPFGSEEVAIDPAIEDPSSPEYAERMRRLRVQQLMQGNK